MKLPNFAHFFARFTKTPQFIIINQRLIGRRAGLVVWGEHDPSFIAPGAEAFRQDIPDAEIHLLDAGHFALDEKTDEIADLILQFMAKHPA
jgi:pimeloyl-ACP methyl ester carboxylesterase